MQFLSPNSTLTYLISSHYICIRVLCITCHLRRCHVYRVLRQSAGNVAIYGTRGKDERRRRPPFLPLAPKIAPEGKSSCIMQSDIYRGACHRDGTKTRALYSVKVYRSCRWCCSRERERTGRFSPGEPRTILEEKEATGTEVERGRGGGSGTYGK